MMMQQVCADCGVVLGKQKFSQECFLCKSCKHRLISEVNTPGIDKAISFFFVVLVVGVVVWWML